MGLIPVIVIGLVAGLVGGIIGAGSSVVPVRASLHRLKAAGPIMAVPAVLANVVRVPAWWREIERRALAAYAATGAPAAALGARIVLLALPPRAIAAVMGVLLVLMIPADVPFRLGHGLTKGAFIGTEAAASLAVSATRTVTSRDSGALPGALVVDAIGVGASLMVGSFIAKPFLLRVDPDVFRFGMDGLLLTPGASLLWRTR